MSGSRQTQNIGNGGDSRAPWTPLPSTARAGLGYSGSFEAETGMRVISVFCLSMSRKDPENPSERAIDFVESIIYVYKT